jgi:hypothetical protein
LAFQTLDPAKAPARGLIRDRSSRSCLPLDVRLAPKAIVDRLVVAGGERLAFVIRADSASRLTLFLSSQPDLSSTERQQSSASISTWRRAELRVDADDGEISAGLA